MLPRSKFRLRAVILAAKRRTPSQQLTVPFHVCLLITRLALGACLLPIPKRRDAMWRSPKQSPKSQTCSNLDQSEKQLAACGFRFPGPFPAGLEHGKNEQRDNAGQRNAATRRTRPIARFAVFFALGICMVLGCFRFPHRGFLRLATTAAHSGHIKTRPRSVRARRSLLPILLRRLPRLLGFLY